jgi:hypothetical protein
MMHVVLALTTLVILGACSQAVTPASLDPAAMPDTIPCDQAVLIKAANSERGIAAERRWLAKHYPGHSRYRQGVDTGPNGRIYDMLSFRRREGREASVCFDITSYYGPS